jgi:hypothetical protein
VIGTEHILLGIIREGDGIAYRILSHFAKDVDAIRWRILAMADNREREKPVNTPFLDEYGRDLTKEAREGKLDPVIGRQEEINPGDPDPGPPYQEQPGAHRGPRGGQDRHRGRAGPGHRGGPGPPHPQEGPGGGH